MRHELTGQHEHPMVAGTKPKSVVHFDCSCGAVCYEPQVWAWHVQQEARALLATPPESGE